VNFVRIGVCKCVLHVNWRLGYIGAAVWSAACLIACTITQGPKSLAIDRRFSPGFKGHLELVAPICRRKTGGEAKPEDEMEFWLVLLLSGGSAPLHIGTFSSMASCEAAARAAVLITPENRAAMPRNFICVQANDSGTHSPVDQPATSPPEKK